MNSEFDKKKQEIEKRENEKINIIQTTKQAKEDIKEQVKKHSGKIGDIIYLVILSIVVLLIIGLVELIDGKFDFSRYSEWSFWIEYVIIQIASWLMRFVYRTVGDRKECRENATYLSLTDDIQKIIDYDSEKPFIDIYAFRDRTNRKTIAWKNKIKYKILKISDKHKINNIVRHINNPLNAKISTLEPFELETDIKGRFSNKKRSKINSKINELMIMITDEWISTNLDNAKVKFNNVNKTILTNGFNASSDNDRIGNDYKSHSTKYFILDNIVSWLFTAVLLFLIIPLIGSKFRKDPSAWLKFLVKSFIVFYAGLLSWWKNNELFTKTKIKALRERKDTLNGYYKDFIKNNNNI